MLERLAEKNAEKVRIVKVNVAKHSKWAQKERVRGVPTFKFYSGGMMVEQFAGAYPEKMMQKKIDRHETSFVTTSSPATKDGKGGSAQKKSTIKPMPKNWLPPGVTSE